MFEFAGDTNWKWLTCFAKNDVSIGGTFLHRSGQHLNKDSVLHCEFALSVFTFSFHIELLGVQRGWHTARLVCLNWTYALFFFQLQMSWRTLKAPIQFAQTAWDHNLRSSQISNLQNSFVLSFRTLFQRCLWTLVGLWLLFFLFGGGFPNNDTGIGNVAKDTWFFKGTAVFIVRSPVGSLGSWKSAAPRRGRRGRSSDLDWNEGRGRSKSPSKICSFGN